MPRWIRFLLVLLFGLAAGLVYGWLVSPVQFVDTTPQHLRIDYRTDYILMVAEEFTVSSDLETAVNSLALLSPSLPVFVVSEALTYAESTDYSPADLEILNKLLAALQVYQLQGNP